MSFFYEFAKELDISSDLKEVICFVAFGKGARIQADYKIISLENDEIVVEIKKYRYKIFGENLWIKTMTKGDIVISGKVCGVTQL